MSFNDVACFSLQGNYYCTDYFLYMSNNEVINLLRNFDLTVKNGAL